MKKTDGLEKTYVEKCDSCIYRENCEGIYKAYLQIFWDFEFRDYETRNN